jgi:hypothetical protein
MGLGIQLRALHMLGKWLPVLFFDTGSLYVAQAGLKFTLLQA